MTARYIAYAVAPCLLPSPHAESIGYTDRLPDPRASSMLI